MKRAIICFSLCVCVCAVAFGATTIWEASPDAVEAEMKAPARASVAVPCGVKKWPRKADRLFIELWGRKTGDEGTVKVEISGGTGNPRRPKKGRYVYLMDMPDDGRRTAQIPMDYIGGAVDLAAVSNIVVRTEDTFARRFGVVRVLALEEGEAAPKTDEAKRVHAADRCEHEAAMKKFRAQCRRGDFLVGWATSMEAVRPRADFPVRSTEGGVAVRLARNEREGVQLLVAPAERDLKDVGIRFVPSGKAEGVGVTASVVGYVETKMPMSYWTRPGRKRPPRGWWPDPILDFQEKCDIEGDDVQSFWVRVGCSSNAPAGTVEGELVVSASNAEPVSVPLRIRVNDFAVGRESPLPLAISFWPDGGFGANVIDGDEALAKRVSSDTNRFHIAWLTRGLEKEYGEFLADYYITWDTLYLNRKREPHWDVLKRLKDEGRLGWFNLGYWWYMGDKPGAEENYRTNSLAFIRRRYDKAKELGLLDHAYIYGCDELSPSVFTNMARSVKVLHEEFPGVPIMTTARDAKLGVDGSPLAEMDIFCPAICFWNPEQVRKSRDGGRKVWWYFCNVPSSPWANTTLEGPPMEIRSLMGAQTQKFKPDGFLYYSTSNWACEKPIGKGPFTDWNPRSFGFYHGDGQWTCCGGPDTMPLATIRLENFRDGLEDLWYARILGERLAAAEKSGGDSCEWLAAARTALAVPDEVAKRVDDFSVDPAVLYRWRDSMADLIERFPHSRHWGLTPMANAAR